MSALELRREMWDGGEGAILREVMKEVKQVVAAPGRMSRKSGAAQAGRERALRSRLQRLSRGQGGE